VRALCIVRYNVLPYLSPIEICHSTIGITFFHFAQLVIAHHVCLRQWYGMMTVCREWCQQLRRDGKILASAQHRLVSCNYHIMKNREVRSLIHYSLRLLLHYCYENMMMVK
jgi:hypothetical protein